MATIQAIWVPEPTGGSNGAVTTGATTGEVVIGFRRLFRIWSDAPSGLNIAFGQSGMAAPTSGSYAIGISPQDFESGNDWDRMRFYNQNASTSFYFIQILSKF